jgi:ribosomal protein S18 acetylase RimI-like enzyme
MPEASKDPDGTPPSILVRPARMDDLPVLLEFEQGIIAAERPYDHTLKPDPISYYNLAEKIASDDAEVAVAEIDGQLVASGFAQKKPSRHYISPPYHAYLGFMYVHPDHRGAGLNQLILDHLCVWAKSRGLPEIHLTVYPENQPAIRAYEKAGFKPYLTEMRINLAE